MLAQIQKWFDDGKEYWKGVIIYSYCNGHVPETVHLLKMARNAANMQVLENELARIFAKERADSLIKGVSQAIGVRNITIKKPDALKDEQLVINTSADNDKLYLACKQEADLLYKSIMNTRANLFAMAEPNGLKPNINTPDEIADRETLALTIVAGFKRVSELYDRADYVKVNGHLPESRQDENDYKIPDANVKQALDNMRKAYNKLKKKPESPNRIQLMQEKEKMIKQLEARWLLLK